MGRDRSWRYRGESHGVLSVFKFVPFLSDSNLKQVLWQPIKTVCRVASVHFWYAEPNAGTLFDLIIRDDTLKAIKICIYLLRIFRHVSDVIISRMLMSQLSFFRTDSDKAIIMLFYRAGSTRSLLAWLFLALPCILVILLEYQRCGFFVAVVCHLTATVTHSPLSANQCTNVSVCMTSVGDMLHHTLVIWLCSKLDSGLKCSLASLFNRFTVPACKISGLKSASARLQTIYFTVLWHYYF